jgi:hypothetical protein
MAGGADRDFLALRQARADAQAAPAGRAHPAPAQGPAALHHADDRHRPAGRRPGRRRVIRPGSGTVPPGRVSALPSPRPGRERPVNAPEADRAREERARGLDGGDPVPGTKPAPQRVPWSVTLPLSNRNFCLKIRAQYEARYGVRNEVRSWRRSHHRGRRWREQSELAANRAMAPCTVPLITQAIQPLKNTVAPTWCHFGATSRLVVPPKTMCRQQDDAQVAPSLLSCPTAITPGCLHLTAA